MTKKFSEELVRRLASARSVAVLTGAGVSAESGVPTFRDPDGLWEKLKPEELANFGAFMSNPKLVQSWYAHRRQIIEDVKPNPAHFALARLEEVVEDFTLITQNVDDLHRRAGSRNVIELHGNITRNYCVSCRRPASDAELATPTSEGIFFCVECGGLIRPDAVWFGEMLPQGAMDRAGAAASRATVFLSIGTSAVVYPAAYLPITAKEENAYVAEINIAESAIADVIDELILGRAGEVLPALVEAVVGLRGVNNET